ncbi:MAG: hypothetical protein QXS20_05055, partial [Candidatus Thorarchaeota archaeon]
MQKREAFWTLVFVLTWFPMGMMAAVSLLGGTVNYTYDFSIYNEEWNGLSEFRIMIETSGREVRPIQSSTSVVSRYEGNAVLAIMGPVKDFTMDTVLVIFQHLMAGGSILIADDFGSANSSFYILNQFIAGQIGGQIPLEGFVAFTGGVLLDLDSYDKTPKLPVITRFNAAPGEGGYLTQGVLDAGGLHLNWATALSPKTIVGMSGIAWTSPRTWCEKNISDPQPYPDPDEWSGVLPVVGAVDLGQMMGIGLPARLVVVSDPSLFNNDMIDRGGNRQFCSNLIEWLANGRTDMPFLFCENLLAVPWHQTEFFFGVYMSRVLWLSTLPYVSALYPLITIAGLRRYIPEPKKPELKSVSEVFMRKGETYFSERMAYYTAGEDYPRAVKLLYRKLERTLRKSQGWTQVTPALITQEMRRRNPSISEEEMTRSLNRIKRISENPGEKVRKSEMMELF